MEIWLLTALAAAAFSSIKASFQKSLTEDYESVQIGFLRSLISLLFLTPLAIWAYLQYGIYLNFQMITGILISGIGNIIAIYLILEALSIEDISIISPLRRTTPIFLAIFEPVILGFSYSINHFLGALMAVLGSFIILTDGKNFFKTFSLTKGSLLALATSLII